MNATLLAWLAEQGPLIVLPVFMAMFLGFGFWAFRPRNKSRMEQYSEIPLTESHDGD